MASTRLVYVAQGIGAYCKFQSLRCIRCTLVLRVSVEDYRILCAVFGSPHHMGPNTVPIAPSHSTLRLEGRARRSDMGDYPRIPPRSDLAPRIRDLHAQERDLCKFCFLSSLLIRKWPNMQTKRTMGSIRRGRYSSSRQSTPPNKEGRRFVERGLCRSASGTCKCRQIQCLNGKCMEPNLTNCSTL